MFLQTKDISRVTLHVYYLTLTSGGRGDGGVSTFVRVTTTNVLKETSGKFPAKVCVDKNNQKKRKVAALRNVLSHNCQNLYNLVFLTGVFFWLSRPILKVRHAIL